MKVAIAVSNPHDETRADGHARSEVPRRDFVALANELDAIVIAPKDAGGSASRLRFLKQSIGTAVTAFRRRREYDVIVSDVDLLGLCMALMLKLTRSKARHVVISHGELGERKYATVARMFRLMSRIDRIVCYGPAAAQAILESGLGKDEQISLVKHAADSEFWRAAPPSKERLIVSAGLEHRDYSTLIAAMAGMDVALTIAAASPWSLDQEAIDGIHRAEHDGLPPNVQVVKCSPSELRDLYTRAFAIAVPLRETFDQSGSLVVYEAMAVGRPVIATRTRGQEALAIVRENETGFLLPTRDVDGWRDCIRHLFDQPDKAARFGRRARKVVESELNLDVYVSEMASLIRSLGMKGPDPALESSLSES